MEVTNSPFEDQKAKGPNPEKSCGCTRIFVNDKQWDLSQPKVKGKSCNIISLSQEDDIAPTTLSAVLKWRDSL